MKIFILGAGGQLGRCLQDKFSKKEFEIFSFTSSQLNIEETQALKKLLLKHEPKFLINAAAYTEVDRAESRPEIANSINHLAVSKIAYICKEMNIKLFHYSTDYVFDGNNIKPYLENDETNPETIYGLTKLKGENSIISSGCSYLIIRTAWVFSEYGKNFFKTMLQLSQKKDEISIVNDQNGCPTYAQDLAQATVDIIKQEKLYSKNGIYHFTGDNPCTWFEFAKEIFSQLDDIGLKTPKELKAVPSTSFKTKAKRPKYSVLSNKKINSDFGIKPSNWQRGIKEVIQKEFSLISKDLY